MKKDAIKNISKLTRQLEIKLAKGIIQWKHKKEGRVIDEKDAKILSEKLTDDAHRIISKRGKEIWAEIKRAYKEGSEEK